MSLQERTARDLERHAQGFSKDAIANLQVVETIVSQLTSIDQPNDIESVAKRTGYSVYQIRRLMNSDQYRDLVRDAMRSHVAPILYRNVQHLERLVDDPETPPALRINVGRELRQLWADLNDRSPVQQQDDRVADALATLESIRQRRKLAIVSEPQPNEPKPEP